MPSVYFVQVGDRGAIKIGTSENVPKRLAQLQTGHPTRLRIIATIDGDATLERALHEELWTWRTGGEWFHPSREVLAVIKREVQRDIDSRAIPPAPKAANDSKIWTGQKSEPPLAPHELAAALRRAKADLLAMPGVAKELAHRHEKEAK